VKEAINTNKTQLMNRLQTPREISDLLQVSAATVLRMAYSGDLPCIAIRKGKRKKIIRFDPVMVEKWLAKRTLKSSLHST